MSLELDKLREAVENDPTNPTLRFELGKALLEGELEESREAILHLQQATRNPHLRAEVLELLSKQGLR